MPISIGIHNMRQYCHLLVQSVGTAAVAGRGRKET